MNLKLGIFFLNSIGDNEANLSIHFFSYHHFKDCAISSMYLEEIYFSYALSEMMKFWNNLVTAVLSHLYCEIHFYLKHLSALLFNLLYVISLYIHIHSNFAIKTFYHTVKPIKEMCTAGIITIWFLSLCFLHEVAAAPLILNVQCQASPMLGV